MRSSSNPCAFVPLEPRLCDAAALGHAYAAPLPYARDGLLFVHREGLYEAGPSPLTLAWSDARCAL